MADFFDCSGCGLCALVCPTWTQHHDIAYLPWGRAKARQGGATAEELRESLETCVQCGACTPICPEKIDLGAEDRRLEQELGLLRPEEALPTEQVERRLVLSQNLRQHAQLYARLAQKHRKHGKRSEILCDKLSWHEQISAQDKDARVLGVGEWLLEKKLIQAHIEPGDLYWMDAALFHARYEKLLPLYDRLRKSRKCELNWNLQRTAMPLGRPTPHFDPRAQYEWVIFNRPVKRIVVENSDDWQWLKENSELPVLHVLELLGDNT